jgi:anti-anti-sigma factor
MIDSPEAHEATAQRCPICETPIALDLPGASGEPTCRHCGHVLWFHKRLTDQATILDVTSGMIAINADIERVSKVLLRPDAPPNLLLNLARVRFVSSAFVAGMIALQRKVKATHGRLILCAMNAIVRETLHGARLDTFFEIRDTEAEALQSL